MFKKSAYNTNCCVRNCFSKKEKGSSIHFHRFPPEGTSFIFIKKKSGAIEKIDQRKGWERALGMKKPASSFLFVCSRHFKPDDYCTKGLVSPRLKRNSIPSRNLPKKDGTKDTSRREMGNVVCLQKINRLMVKEVETVKEKPCGSSEQLDCSNNDADQDINFEDLNEDERMCVVGLLKIKGVIDEAK